MASPSSSPPSWSEAIMQKVGGFGHLFDYNRKNDEAEHPPAASNTSMGNDDDHDVDMIDEDRDQHQTDHREEEDLLNEILGMTSNLSANRKETVASCPSPLKANAHDNEQDEAQDLNADDAESVSDFEMDLSFDDRNAATMMFDPSSKKTNKRLADLRKEAMGMIVDYSSDKNEEHRLLSPTNSMTKDDDKAHVDTTSTVVAATEDHQHSDRLEQEDEDERESVIDFEMDPSHDDPNHTATTMMIDTSSSKTTMKKRLANLRKEAMGIAADDDSLSDEISEASSFRLDNETTQGSKRKDPLGFRFDYGAASCTPVVEQGVRQASVPWNPTQAHGGRNNSMDSNMMEVDFPTNMMGPSSSPSESGSLSGYSSMDEKRSYYGYATILETTGVIVLPPYIPRLADFPWLLHFVSNIRRSSSRKRLGEYACEKPHLKYAFQDLSLLSLHHNVITRFLCVVASHHRHQQKMLDCDYFALWEKAACLKTGLQEYHQLLKRAERASRPPPPPYHYSLLNMLQNKGGRFYAHKGKHPLGSKKSRIETKKRELGALIPYVDPSSSNENAASSSIGIWMAAFQVALCIYQCQQKKLLGCATREKTHTMPHEDKRGAGSNKRSFSALTSTVEVHQEMTAEKHHRKPPSQQPTIPRLRGKRVLLLDPKGSVSDNKRTKLGFTNDPVGPDGTLGDAAAPAKTKTMESTSQSNTENDDMRAKETSLLSRFGLATRREVQDQGIGGGRVAPTLSKQKLAPSSRFSSSLSKQKPAPRSHFSFAGDIKPKSLKSMVGESSRSTLQERPPPHTVLRCSSPSALNKHVKRKANDSEIPTLQATDILPSKKLCDPLKNKKQMPQTRITLTSSDSEQRVDGLVPAVRQSRESRPNLSLSISGQRSTDDQVQRPLSPALHGSSLNTDVAAETKKDRKRRRKEEKKARKAARSQRRAEKRQKKAPIATITPIPKVPLELFREIDSPQNVDTFPETQARIPDKMSAGYMKKEPSDAARANVSSVVHNHSVPFSSISSQVLCSERFIECWGSVAAELSKTKKRSNRNESFSFVDTDLLDMLGVDIENSMGEAVVVFRAGADEMEASFLKRFVEIVATGRYSVLHLVVSIDVRHPQLQAYVQRLHNAVLRYKAVPTTYVNLELVSPNSVSTCLADLLSMNGMSKSLGLEKWLIDERSRERMRFLISVVPTLGLLGAIQCLAFTTDREVPSTDAHFHDLLTSKTLRGRIQECVHRKSPQTSTIKSASLHHLQVAAGSNLTPMNFS